jgi:hypothetical protein
LTGTARIENVESLRVVPGGRQRCGRAVPSKQADGVEPEEADLIDRCKRREPGAFE